MVQFRKTLEGERSFEGGVYYKISMKDMRSFGGGGGGSLLGLGCFAKSFRRGGVGGGLFYIE